MRVLVAGAGWLGGGIARRLLAEGHGVVAVRRDGAALRPLAGLGATVLALDLAQPGAARSIPTDVDAIVACQSSSVDSADAYRRAYVAANRALLEAAGRDGVRAFVYTGSTGVFGQREGGDVDERSATAPAGPAGEVLVEAERTVFEAASRGVRACVVRLSGLYGPGRAGILERVRTGRLALGPGDDAWMNFCHLDDAVSFVLAGLERGEPGLVYHGSDAAPARRREVVEWIAAKLGIPPPCSDGGPPGPNRRILSGWSRQALGVALRYPSFREGLAPIIGEGAPSP
ncbi:MAG TPA: NAD-dependent epimerase/dehydratase family protein [Anaeromyxobacteraceae bacterium]|nr:NAD-dependent epimerase/dehydratase family protein [Anaeromyxobacteraceae bacterium]